MTIHRFLGLLLAGLIAWSPASAQTPLPVLFRSAPAWVLQTGGALPSLDIDFANTQAWVAGTGSQNPPDLITVTRASNETTLLPSSASGAAYLTFGNGVAAIVPGVGLQVYQAATNNLLNSTAPATQTTASLGTGSYTLWVNGTGSATPSGATATITGAAAATNGSPNTFTVTVAGTVTVTVSGSLNAFQLESGTFGTPLIVTAGATATRAADVITLAGAAATAALNAKAAYFVAGGTTFTAANPAIFSYGGSTQGVILRSSTTIGFQNAGGAQQATATLGNSTTVSGLTKIATGFDTSSFTIVVNGGAKATSANSIGSISGTPYLGVFHNGGGNSSWYNGPLQRIAFGPVKGQFDGLTQ